MGKIRGRSRAKRNKKQYVPVVTDYYYYLYNGNCCTLELKFTEEASSPHFIFFKEHSVREQTEDKPSGRTLFALNIPPYVDKAGLKRAFSDAGKVSMIIFCKKPSSNQISEPESKSYFTTKTIQTFRVAYIIFEKVSELDKALKLKHLKPLYVNENKPKCGVYKWVEEYNTSVPFTKALKKEIDDFMKQHDDKTDEAMEKEKDLHNEDEEGWMTVTKKGNVSSFARTEKVETKIMQKEALGKKRKELKNFYTFQIRESKMKHIVALRQKFEEDKKKIAHIKQSRRFKPF